MRIPNSVKQFSITLLVVIISTFSTEGQEVLKLSENDTPGKADLSQLKWLEGFWEGEGFGGKCDEIWMPAVDNCMAGIFRFAMNDTLNFSEFIVIEEVDSSLVVKLKHFSRDLTPWEDKNDWTVFKLVKLEGQTAWFNGLTYHRKEDKLIIKLALHSEGETRIEEFLFNKKQL